MCLGFACGPDFRARAQPGWRGATWGFHGDDGAFHDEAADDEYAGDTDMAFDNVDEEAERAAGDAPAGNAADAAAARLTELEQRWRQPGDALAQRRDVNQQSRTFGVGDTVGAGVLWPSGDIFFW